ncbi:hypothetical protein LCGC14_1291690 [marine sediment metagenome]|uniref:DUF6651 domain-containing protein n=1 Tax=marine sediment metagenome TaxID=412755 RepID=A0A0F9NV45_9ZZZZ
MAMKLKIDENGNAVLQDGKPVYMTEDDKEFVADVPAMHSKTLELKSEAKRNREKAEAAESQLAVFAVLFPDMDSDALKTWKTGADDALTTVKNLGDKELLDAGKVEEIKTELKEAHDKNLLKVKTQFGEKEDAYVATIAGKDERIFDLMVGNAFVSSKFFSGEEPVTTMLPDAALALFGPMFKVQENKTTKVLEIVGYHGGDEILSSQPDMVGEIAPVEEALEQIINRYPGKERIMQKPKSGSGAGGGQGGGGGDDTDLAKLIAQHKKAVDEGKGREAISLKTRIHALQTKTRTA